MKEKNSKILYLEVLRIISIFFVIFNHTGTNGFFLFSAYKSTEIQYWVYLFVSIFCKFSVPMFLAISGALMLGKENESIHRIWTKKIPKIFITLMVFSLGYYVYDCYTNAGMVFSWKEFAIRLYSSNLKYHLWYIYIYIPYLILLPFLNAMVKNLNDKGFKYLIALAVCFNGIIPTVDYRLSQGNVAMNGALKNPWVLTSVVLYPCIGYYLHHKNEKKIKPWVFLFIWGCNIIGIGLSCYLTYYKSTVTGVLSESESQGFHMTYVVINCITLFITVKYVVNHVKVPILIEKIILSLGSCTFGIYLWHAWFRSLPVYYRILDKLHHTGLNYMLSIWIVCLLIMLVSYLATLIMSKIPVVRKLVGFK